MFLKKFFLICCSAISIAQAGAPPREFESIKFGFLNETNTHLQSLESLSDTQAKDFTQARCTDTDALSLTYLRTQTKQSGDSVRDNASNFTKRAGSVFKVVGEVKPDKGLDNYCFIFSKDFLNRHTLLTPKQMGNVPLRAVTAQRIAAAKKRPIKEAWFLAQLDADTSAVMVRFVRQGQSELLSLVLLKKDTLYFYDHATIYNETSTWRVDDGNEFSPRWYRVVFGYKQNNTYGLGIAWAGAESQLLSVIELGKNSKPLEVAGGSFYTSP